MKWGRWYHLHLTDENTGARSSSKLSQDDSSGLSLRCLPLEWWRSWHEGPDFTPNWLEILFSVSTRNGDDRFSAEDLYILFRMC